MRSKGVRYTLLFTISIILCSCDEKSTLPVDIEKRIFGAWVISPDYHSNAFIMYKYDSLRHDKCSMMCFRTTKEFYWRYMDKNSTNYLTCGNTLRPDPESTWYFDGNSIILDKIQRAVDETERVKLEYSIYESSPDTFTFILQDTLLNEHKTGLHH